MGVVLTFCQHVACISFSIALGKLRAIQLKMRRFIMFHTVRDQSGSKTFEGHFELIIMCFVDTCNLASGGKAESSTLLYISPCNESRLFRFTDEAFPVSNAVTRVPPRAPLRSPARALSLGSAPRARTRQSSVDAF